MTIYSYDIFDTLIVRPFVRPDDLFSLLFPDKEVRVDAEREARKNRRREITLGEIYSELPLEYGPLKEQEERLEIAVSLPVPSVVSELREHHSAGDTIILASDMYLSKDVIAKMLRKCSIPYDRLYVSSEYECSKHDGGMYDIILDDLGVEPSDIVHTGDNRHSDYNMPRRKGIRAILRESPISRYLDHNPDIRRYCRKGGVDRSIIASIDMLGREGIIGSSRNGWMELGRRFGGPLIYGYTDHLCRAIPEGSGVIFAARDCRTVMDAVDIISPDKYRKSYLNLQRIYDYVLTDHVIPFGEIHPPERVSHWFEHDRDVAHIRYLLDFFKDDVPVEPDDDIVSAYNNEFRSCCTLKSLILGLFGLFFIKNYQFLHRDQFNCKLTILFDI